MTVKKEEERDCSDCAYAHIRSYGECMYVACTRDPDHIFMLKGGEIPCDDYKLRPKGMRQ